MKSILKILISLFLIFFVLRQIDFSEIYNNIANFSLLTCCLVVFGYFLGQCLSAYKWNLIAQNISINSKYFNAFNSYFKGMFINAFGLGIVGGDVSRAIFLDRKNTKLAGASVIIDRAHGLGILALIGLFFSFISKKQIPHFKIIFLIQLGVTLSVLCAWTFSSKLSFISKKIKLNLDFFPKNLGFISKISLISLAFHIFQIFLHWLIITSFGKEVSFLFLLAAIPCINILTSLPISWQGLGVREVAYITFFSPTFLSKAECATMGAIWLIAVCITSCVGGGLFWSKSLGD